MIKAIAAIDSKRGLADENGIPWRLPTDLLYYRKMATSGGSILMGYGTYVEFTKPFGEAENVVASDTAVDVRPGFNLTTDARSFLQQAKGDVWVIGGAGLFATTLDLIDELYLTHVRGDFTCTKFFPDYQDRFELVSQSEPIVENGISFTFAIDRRK